MSSLPPAADGELHTPPETDPNDVIDSDDKEVLEEEPRSMLMAIISQLRKGMDLHRVTLPTFVLEPRSMLERITDFMSHPEFILNLHDEPDQMKRFVRVVQYYLSGWHIKPKGVKKPYNPILGEVFRCKWKMADGSESIYVAEQVSHHPPISAYFYANPDHHLVIEGNLKPKSKFLGNSAATLMNGWVKIRFLNRPDEIYEINMPNVYVRGILFGTMVLELGDIANVICRKTGFSSEIDFKVKGFFSGSYNAIQGKIKQGSKVTHKLSGNWSEVIEISTVNGKTESEKQMFFNALNSKICPKTVAPEAAQEVNESRRLWSKVTKALVSRDIDTATVEKTAIEDEQRRTAKLRESEDIDWQPHFFKRTNEDDFILKLPFNNAEDLKGRLEELVFKTELRSVHRNEDIK